MTSGLLLYLNIFCPRGKLDTCCQLVYALPVKSLKLSAWPTDKKRRNEPYADTTSKGPPRFVPPSCYIEEYAPDMTLNEDYCSPTVKPARNGGSADLFYIKYSSVARLQALAVFQQRHLKRFLNILSTLCMRIFSLSIFDPLEV